MLSLLGLLLAFYVHGLYVFSAGQIEGSVNEMVQAGLDGKLSVCRNLGGQTRLDITVVHPFGETRMEGDRYEDACGKLQGASLAISKLGMRVRHDMEVVSIERAGLPWTQARADLRHDVSVEMPMGLMVRGDAGSDITLRRGFTGPVITRIRLRLTLAEL
ncbi:hypothetical protein NBRC116584_22050 [Hydrogenophaga sp. 5NK40-0174]